MSLPVYRRQSEDGCSLGTGFWEHRFCAHLHGVANAKRLKSFKQAARERAAVRHRFLQNDAEFLTNPQTLRLDVDAAIGRGTQPPAVTRASVSSWFYCDQQLLQRCVSTACYLLSVMNETISTLPSCISPSFIIQTSIFDLGDCNPLLISTFITHLLH